MEELRRYSTGNISKYSFLLLLILVAGGLADSFILFSRSDSRLLLNFTINNFLDKMLFYLPVYFIVLLSYTVNISFPDNEAGRFQSKNIIGFFITYAAICFFIIVILIELLNSFSSIRKDEFRLKDIDLKLKEQNIGKVNKWMKEADNFISEKKYDRALDKLQEIKLLVPGYKEAREKIDVVTGRLEVDKENRQAGLKKDGIRLFNEKKYKPAIGKFNIYLEMNPNDREVLKFLNLASQSTNRPGKIIRDKNYGYIMELNENIQPMIMNNNKIRNFIKEGRTEFSNKNYEKAKECFKKILAVDVDNYEAYSYIARVNEEVNNIMYTTNRFDKLIKSNLSFINGRYNIFIGELRRGKGNDYVFYNTVFKEKRSGISETFKWGYFDKEDKLNRKYIFKNNIKSGRGLFKADDLNPELIWTFNDIKEFPERFSFYQLWDVRKYCLDDLNDMKLFFLLAAQKINYYILVLFLIINFTVLFYYLRKRSASHSSMLLTSVFLFIIAFLVSNVFIFLFQLLKKILFLSLNIDSITLLVNAAYYISLFIIFLIFFGLAKFGKDGILIMTQKKKNNIRRNNS